MKRINIWEENDVKPGVCVRFYGEAHIIVYDDRGIDSSARAWTFCRVFSGRLDTTYQCKADMAKFLTEKSAKPMDVTVRAS